MATIKSYTDISQSKTLSKILPLESADMFYVAGKGEPIFIGNKMVAYGDDDYDALGEPDVLCWSLAALLGVLPYYEINNNGVNIQLSVKGEALITEKEENLLDLAVNMIIRLNELNLL